MVKHDGFPGSGHIVTQKNLITVLNLVAHPGWVVVHLIIVAVFRHPETPKDFGINVFYTALIRANLDEMFNAFDFMAQSYTPTYDQLSRCRILR